MSSGHLKFNNVEIHSVTVHEKPWTRAKDICRALHYRENTKTADVVERLCTPGNFANKREVDSCADSLVVDWPEDSNKDDYYLNEEGVGELILKIIRNSS